MREAHEYVARDGLLKSKTRKLNFDPTINMMDDGIVLTQGSNYCSCSVILAEYTMQNIKPVLILL